MTGLLRSVWDAPAASPPPPRRVWRDWALVGILAPCVVLEALVRRYHEGLPFAWLQAIIVLGLVATLLWRRARPLLMFAITFVATTFLSLLVGADNQLGSSVFLLVLAYCVFRWGSGKAGILGLAMMLGIFVFSIAFTEGGIGDIIGGVAVILATIALALVFRFRASGRMREIERAKSFEREQLARDLHDTVAHHVSAIAIQAQAGLAVAANDPAAARRALTIIEAEASRTLAEMRSMVRVLRREGEAELAPARTVGDLAEFATASAGTDHDGPRVEVTLNGAVDTLPPTVAAAVYRLAQESITNARRHAKHATRIEVAVEVTDAGVQLTVSDDGDTVGGPGPGYGITGMTERATLLGGTLEAGRAPGGGWTVVATLPREGWAL